MRHEIVNCDSMRRKYTRGAVSSPILQFSLSDFFIDKSEFLKWIRPTYRELDEDRYDVLFTTERVVLKFRVVLQNSCIYKLGCI